MVVNNAGGAPFAGGGHGLAGFHQKIVALNLIAPLHVSQRANEVMQQRGGGSIIMIGSVSGLRPSPGTAAYGAAKAGLHHLAASLAVEWAPEVRVNCVVAGATETEQAALALRRRRGGRGGRPPRSRWAGWARRTTSPRRACSCRRPGRPTSPGPRCCCTAAASFRRSWPRLTPSTPRTCRRPRPGRRMPVPGRRGSHGQFHSAWLARRAPSAIAASLAQVTCGIDGR